MFALSVWVDPAVVCRTESLTRPVVDVRLSVLLDAELTLVWPNLLIELLRPVVESLLVLSVVLPVELWEEAEVAAVPVVLVEFELVASDVFCVAPLDVEEVSVVAVVELSGFVTVCPVVLVYP